MKDQRLTGDFPTGQTGLCHQSSAAVSEAAVWYAAQIETCEHMIIPTLRRRFGPGATEAVIAIQKTRKNALIGHGFGGRD